MRRTMEAVNNWKNPRCFRNIANFPYSIPAAMRGRVAPVMGAKNSSSGRKWAQKQVWRLNQIGKQHGLAFTRGVLRCAAHNNPDSADLVLSKGGTPGPAAAPTLAPGTTAPVLATAAISSSEGTLSSDLIRFCCSARISHVKNHRKVPR